MGWGRMDMRVVETLNRWFAANAFRADLGRALAIVPLLLIGALVVAAWATHPSSAPDGGAVLVLGMMGAVAALLLNLGLGHLFYRARPFLVLDIHPLLPEAVDSSLFSDHLAAAGAAVAALLLVRRSLGWVGLGSAGLLALGRGGTGVQYPTDCFVRAALGGACVFPLMPLLVAPSPVLA